MQTIESVSSSPVWRANGKPPAAWAATRALMALFVVMSTACANDDTTDATGPVTQPSEPPAVRDATDQ